MRTGIGCDVHRLEEGCKLVLGGVEIPFEKGLKGWSDGDALTHAVIDGLLGAASLGDIGRHFPPGNKKYEGISSLILLKQVSDMLKRDKLRISNLDCIVIAEKPHLAEYIDKIQEKLSKTLAIGSNQINIKAKTSEEIGSLGRGEGIAAWASVLLEEVE